MTAQPIRAESTYMVSYREVSGRNDAILRRMSRCGQNTYLAAISWVLFLQFLAVAAGSHAWQVQLAMAATGTLLSAFRLTDAGYSRWLATLAVPTLAASWIFPVMFAGAPAMGLLAQFFSAIVGQNGAQFLLALALLAVPTVIGLAPAKRQA
jgi:hypothetical protein